MWSDIIYSSENKLISDKSHNLSDKEKYFTNQVAAGLCIDFQKSLDPVINSNILNKCLTESTEAEKSFWYNFAAEIPDKFKALNLYIRPFKDFCRTCIITDEEISNLVKIDHERYISNKIHKGITRGNNRTSKSKSHISLISFEYLIQDWKRFFMDLNYLIPVELKKTGYEVIRDQEAAEIDRLIVRKLARAFHSKYLQEIRNQRNIGESSILNDQGELGNQYSSDFDDLQEDIKNSNADNASHIPTKLLSIGYTIRHVREGFKPIALNLNEEEIEAMSRVEHLRWSWEKRLNGWTYGSIKDDIRKTHPSLIPYEELSESEKEKDRQLVKLIPALLQDLKFEACPVSPNRISKLSYAIKPQSSIHKILEDTRELNDQIRKLVMLTPEVEEMVRIRNNKIEEAIIEVKESYNYAQHIQETFLPDSYYVRECFPDSFVLFKPKDIVSGDFYFFSKRGDNIFFAAADCTGHGIPGALLSTLGYGILDQAVNEIKLNDPSEILHHLYFKIHRFLRDDPEGTGMSDDMDIILSVLDIRTNILTFSGVKNPIYQIAKGVLVVHRAQNTLAECIEDGKFLFTSEKIQLNTGDTIYLCTDGYTDQFGGKNHKKYQTGRLMSFLQSISKCSMSEQSDKLYEAIEQWREENNENQTDDILIIGIRI
jgi:serine phosphatase RsbU (regulator of sigma subunit)